MKVLANGNVYTLSLYDLQGVNWARDFIGNWHALDQFEAKSGYLETKYGVYAYEYVVDVDTVVYWRNVIRKEQQLIDLVEYARNESGHEVVDLAICNALDGANDLEDVQAATLQVIRDVAPETAWWFKLQ